MIAKKNLNALFNLCYKNMKSVQVCSKRNVSFLDKPVEGKYLVGDYGINVLRIGKGQDVLCLPGLMGTIWTDFSHQITGFNLEKYALTVWDPPGYGQSRPPTRDFSHGFLERDADLLALLIEKLEIQKCNVLGWSDGGATALVLASKYPKLVNKLVIWGVNSYVTSLDLKAYKSIQDISNWSESMKKPLIEIYGERKLQVMMDAWVNGMDYISRFWRGDLIENYLQYIDNKVLIIHGEKDPIVPRFHAEHLYVRLRGSRILFVENGKHNLHMRHAEDFNKTVMDYFLGE